MGRKKVSRKANKVSKQALIATPKRTADQAQEKAAAMAPTPEMLARVSFEYGDVKSEMGIKVGAAYRRRPLYQTMAKKAGRFTADEFAALEAYRSVFDRCERSPVASCLAAQHGGGGRSPGSFIHASPSIVEAKRKLGMLERGLGQTLATMRDVVLLDKSFSVVAMERFGCRRRNWIIVDEPVMKDGRALKKAGKPITRAAFREDLAPRSGRHRQIIADEFACGLRLLTTAASRLSGAVVDELWVQPRADGTAIIHRASVAPNGLYRMWGPGAVVTSVIDQLLQRHNDCLVFPTPEAARDALVEAAGVSLHCLGPDDLAA